MKCPICGNNLTNGYCNDCGVRIEPDRKTHGCGCAAPISREIHDSGTFKKNPPAAVPKSYQNPAQPKRNIEKKRTKHTSWIVILILVATFAIKNLPDLFTLAEDAFSNTGREESLVAVPEPEPDLPDITGTTRPEVIPSEGTALVLSGEDTLADLFQHPMDHIGEEFSFGGQVWSDPWEILDGFYAFDMRCGFDDSYRIITVVTENDPGLVCDQVVYAAGTVYDFDSYEDSGSEGQMIYYPLVAADPTDIKAVDYTELFPAEKTFMTGDAVLQQEGYQISIDKIESCSQETRIYITKTNEGDATFHLDNFSFSVFVDGTSLPEAPYLFGVLPELESDTMPGKISSGVLRYEALPESPILLEITAEGYYGEAYGALGTYQFVLDLS